MDGLPRFPLWSRGRELLRRRRGDGTGNEDRAWRAGTLWRLFVLNYVALLGVAHAYLEEVDLSNPGATAFALAVYFTYCVTYLLPVFVPLLALNHLVSWAPGARLPRGVGLTPSTAVYGAAVPAFAFVQLFVYIDTVIYDIYGFHLNGFVWNLLTTEGGVESMGGGASTYAAAAGVVAGALGFEAGLLWALVRLAGFRRVLARVFTRRVVAGLVACILFMTGLERLAYGVSSAYAYRPVLMASRAFLFYVPCTFDLPEWVAPKAGARRPSIHFKSTTKGLNYPLRPIRSREDAARYNIVWLCAESWRADMVDPEIMPATHGFARSALFFQGHYSGGNGTRMGIFSMFYGLYGNYWFPFLDAGRGPVLVDFLLDRGYQFGLFTSARFTYPEFDRTVWARIDPGEFHEGDGGLKGWENDRRNVEKLLQFIDGRDRKRPFFTFMFFESPHARYYFPPESVIRKPYLEDFNYVTTDLEENIGLIKNRYINSCNHLDSQYGRVLDYLRAHDLLDSTVVILTGDHGEEFMEKGRWGHNSTFSEEQVRTPLVLWIPGQTPRRIDRMTSHVDLPPTLLTLLGVENPAAEYCLGQDLLGECAREYAVLGDWSDLCYVGPRYKAEFSLQSYGFMEPMVTTRDDGQVEDAEAFLDSRRDRFALVMKEMARFAR